mmetsp:Transcript_11554/g.23271  ORF Transcript_11554/g.23271 Transcript_11554/m.23271 type:complete len:108 (-) Transcript_11554:259-582(-)
MSSDLRMTRWRFFFTRHLSQTKALLSRNNICGTRMSSRSSISRLALYPNIVSETAIDAENPNTSITHRHMQPLLSAAIVAPSSTYFDHYTVHLAYLGCSLLMLRTDK